MYSCVVCHEDESREESVDEVFEVDDTCLCVACLRRCAAVAANGPSVAERQRRRAVS